ncbi:MAG TPA: hypothetical protein DSN98_08715 [Thermoplasmata archaeon]|jgi:hypothetical protein|nr:MAG TPA: hypothetical protein DSN98_08715 [Thermoplasmata archaeon]
MNEREFQMYLDKYRVFPKSSTDGRKESYFDTFAVLKGKPHPLDPLPDKTLDDLGLDIETKANLNRWMNRRVSRLEREAEFYKANFTGLADEVSELRRENVLLRNEVELLKKTGFFPAGEKRKDEKNHRFSTIDV